MTLEALTVLLPAVLVLAWLSRRFGLVEPPVLLLGGVALGFVPHVDRFELPPELVLTVLLPGLLYWESITTSLREVRANLRVIVLLAVGLVTFTTVVVAAVLHACGVLDWTGAFIAGAVLAPTDAAAVAALAYLLPRRFMTMLRAESLINDGTALVLFAAAVDVAVSGRGAQWGHLWLELMWSYGGGVLIGALVATVVVAVRKRLHEPTLEGVLSIATPYVAYLPAEKAHASGVLAVVVCGLLLSRFGMRHIAAEARQRTFAFWGLATYTINAGLFVLVGIEVVHVGRALPSSTLAQGFVAVGVATVAVVVARFVWSYGVTVVIRTVDRRPSQRDRRVSARRRVPTAWAGVRGGVSLAAALAIPLTTDAGRSFPDRDLIVFVAGGVVLLTLVVQGSTLPAVIRWARYDTDPAEVREHHHARLVMLEAAVQHLASVHEKSPDHTAVVDSLRATMERQRSSIPDPDSHADDVVDVDEVSGFETELRLELVAAEREALIGLRDGDEIDGMVFMRLQSVLDSDEKNLRLADAARRGELDGAG